MSIEINYLIYEKDENGLWRDISHLQFDSFDSAKEIYTTFCDKYPNTKFKIVERETKTIVDYLTVLTNDE